MQQKRKFGTIIAALALALCLGLGPVAAHAQGMVPLDSLFYKVVNSSGKTIE